MSLIGRKEEQIQLSEIVNNSDPSFVALYGRRRVGKTFLIKEYFNHQFTFYVTGLANANTQIQLKEFNDALQVYFGKKSEVPENWMAAFKLLKKYLNQRSGKQVVFLDELPWFDYPRSDFMTGLEWFWNSWGSTKKNLKFIVCGSAASWMINKLLRNTGGLHNRVTHIIKVNPFTLSETEFFLKAKNVQMSRYQIAKLYMALGGIPFYLSQIRKGETDVTAIERLCFSSSGLLRNEFGFIFKSLFKESGQHELIIQKIYELGRQATRDRIIEATQIKSSGDFTKKLQELEESGFISSYVPYGLQKSKKIYLLSDYFSLFHFKFLTNVNRYHKGIWVNRAMDATINTWYGLTFEFLCFDHIEAITKALGIDGMHYEISPWIQKGNSKKSGAQIDLIISRKDKAINICEIKFSAIEYSITKNYDLELRRKVALFAEVTQTNKSLLCTVITTMGLRQNTYSGSFVQSSIVLDNLFDV